MGATRSRKFLAISLAFLFTLALINYLDRIALSVAGKMIATEFTLTPVQLGYFFSSFLWSYVICVIPCGILADRFGAKRVIGGGISLWSLATVGTGLAPGFGSLLFSRIVMGAGEATTYPAAIRLIRATIPAANRGFATATFNSGAYAGPAFGSILISWLVATFGWRISFVIAGLTGFVWLALWLAFLKQGSSERSDEQEALKTPMGGGASTDLRALLGSSSLWGTALTQGLSIYTLYFLLTWLPTYLQTTRGLNITQAGLIGALPYIGAVIFNILLSRLNDRVVRGNSSSRRRWIGAMMLLSAALVFTPYVDDIRWLVAIFTISLTGISTAGSLNMTLASDLLTNPNDAGKVNSVVVLGGNIFGILAPIVTGYIVAGSGSYDYAFLVAGVLAISGAIISQVLTRVPIGIPSASQRESM
jgi:MFS family permease